MAAAAATPLARAAATGERLAAALQGLGDALSLEAQAGRMPEEVQELVGSWDVRTRALVGALAGGAEGGLLQEADATAAAELLQPLLSEAFAAALPDLFEKTLDVGGTILGWCSAEVGVSSNAASRAHAQAVLRRLSRPSLTCAAPVPQAHNTPQTPMRNLCRLFRSTLDPWGPACWASSSASG
jgi:hypothetical protein